MTSDIEIRVGEYAVGSDMGIIKTSGVGSCVVICLYDEDKKIGGMVHAMMPTRIDIHSDATKKNPKFVNDGIDLLYEDVLRIGGTKGNIIAKLVGGASLFSIFGPKRESIGERNIESAKKKLGELNIRIESENTGGKTGRMVNFNLANGIIYVVSQI